MSLVKQLRAEARLNGARSGDPLARKNQRGSRFYTDGGGRVFLTPKKLPHETRARPERRPAKPRGKTNDAVLRLAELMCEVELMEARVKEMQQWRN